MAQTLDKFVLSFFMDTSGLKKGGGEVDNALNKTRQNVDQNTKAFQKQASTALDGLRKMRNEILAIGGAYLGLGALKSFATNLLAQDVATYRLSKNLGMATKELSAWELAAEQLGSSKGDIDNSLRLMVKYGEQFKNGQVATDTYMALSRTGINAAKFFDQSIGPAERFLMVAQALRKMKPQDAQYWGAQLLGSEQAATMAMQGEAAIKLEVAKQRIYAVDEKSAKAELAMQQRINNIASGFRNIGRELVLTLGPAVLQIAEQFSRWLVASGAIQKMAAGAQWLAAEINSIPWDTIAADIKMIAKGADEAAAAVGGWGNVLKGLAAVWVGGKLLGFLGDMRALGAVLGAEMPASSLGGVLVRLSALGASAAAGWALGNLINDKMVAGTKLGEWLGQKEAEVLAMFGNEEAQHALDVNGVRHNTTANQASGRRSFNLPAAIPPGAVAGAAAQRAGGGTVNNSGTTVNIDTAHIQTDASTAQRLGADVAAQASRTTTRAGQIAAGVNGMQ